MRRAAILIALVALHVATAAVAQEREYTAFERERFDLDKRFEATVLLNDGSKFTVTNFHFDTAIYKHKVHIGESNLGMLQPLSNIQRIVRSRKKGWVHLIYLNDSEMHTPLKHSTRQRFAGTKEDGSKWVAALEEVAEVEVREVKTAGK